MFNKSIQDARYRAAIDALREHRQGLRLSQATLASAVGRSQQFVSKYESFERRLDIIEFIDLARVLGFDWQRFLDRL